MKIAFFDTHEYEKTQFELKNKNFNFEIDFLSFRLTEKTSHLAKGYDAICAFVEDKLNKSVLDILKKNNIKIILLRSAGFNHIDLKYAFSLGIRVYRVPEYSSHAIAEHAVALIMSLNRKIHKAYNRVREQNFSLDGLVGFDLYQKTIGVIGTGKIGSVFIEIMKGFGTNIIVYDKVINPKLNVKYTSLKEIFEKSDIISLHLPLNEQTKHIINSETFKLTKKNLLLINTGRGALIDTKALISALKKDQIGGAGLDVYEEEEGVFFHDMSKEVIQDDNLIRLISFPNVIITSHQAFLTNEALEKIAEVTLSNVSSFLTNKTTNSELTLNNT